MKTRALKKVLLFAGFMALLWMWPYHGTLLSFPGGPTVVDAQEESSPATLGDARREASDEAARAGEHARNLKESVKSDTTEAGKAVKTGVVSGFKILKEGVRSVLHGEGVRVKRQPGEEEPP
jgi:hypothetical protein